MMNKFILIFLFVLSCFSSVFAQNDSNTRLRACALSRSDVIKKDSFEFELKKKISIRSTSKVSDDTTLIIPIVFHILWFSSIENISDGSIYTQIDELNKCFNANNRDITLVPDGFKKDIGKANIKFCLPSKDENGNATTGIVRKRVNEDNFGTKDSSVFFSSMGGDDAWDTEKYLNVWIVNTGDYVSGYGIYPWAVSKARNGVVIHPRYVGGYNQNNNNYGRTLVHEMGHFFGLYHLWMDDKDCSTDDGITDTPPQSSPYFDVPKYPQISCGSLNMFMNFMDYVDDNAMQLFTQGQIDKMLKTLSVFKPKLANNLNTQCQTIDVNNQSFEVFPNPFFNEITIEIDNTDLGYFEAIVFDILGRVVGRFYFDKIPQPKIDLGYLNAGIYFIKIGNNTKKLVKTIL